MLASPFSILNTLLLCDFSAGCTEIPLICSWLSIDGETRHKGSTYISASFICYVESRDYSGEKRVIPEVSTGIKSQKKKQTNALGLDTFTKIILPGRTLLFHGRKYYMKVEIGFISPRFRYLLCRCYLSFPGSYNSDLGVQLIC